MASIKDLKKRIGTVKNTQQTTRAMKMVSAAKLRRAQEAIQNQRPYANGSGQLIHLLARRVHGTDRISVCRASCPKARKRELLFVVVSSDRGLCGGFNSNVIKGAQKWLLRERRAVRIGSARVCRPKAHDFFKIRKVNMGPYYRSSAEKSRSRRRRSSPMRSVELYASGESTK